MTRADELIACLQLTPHPEGGYFREIYRSELTIQAFEPAENRSAVTTIFFLLKRGQCSRLHQISSDEIWHYYEGDPLELIWGSLDGSSYERRMLGKVGDQQLPVLTVPAGAWQAARPAGEYTLVGCTVAPGFEFRSFRMLADLPHTAADVVRGYPELRDFL